MKGDKMRQKRFQRKKFCRFCADKTAFIDYKDIKTLRNYITERGKILSRKMTGACSAHQRELTVAIQRARNIALLPFMER
ncbi:MAG: 30S ribosomal protein S18 [Nitrospirae bacterium GWC2_46_6]|nr:MAG: 30S ribosomal protein S18 [Nitrospirae bacterium GWC2_46_6]OGW22117.1 MAG: 30S ribosomal protein S18 [Nitrospirae bacterium GWA2_46_11]OGW24337.1 MAG: 30S ribosomal protein S18 [Nitrospirae bacterium GWB2_47_37]HAK88420.1 30S ribosomal protein S18 [Nitrospiraceae bacterium]HCL81262.1 30S ribosomal protein S18 [Nitrospiraceae bacterium]